MIHNDYDPNDDDDSHYTPGFYGTIPLTPDNILKLIKIPKRYDSGDNGNDDDKKNDTASSTSSTKNCGIGIDRITELVCTSHDGEEANLSSCKLPFVWKLYEMLEDVEREGKDHIVSWVDNGKAFKVHKLKEFVTDVIPYYFKQSKYKSFQRQLNLYQFVRTMPSSSSVPSGRGGSKTNCFGAYSHPKFVRGQKSFCLQMTPQSKRNKQKKNIKKQQEVAVNNHRGRSSNSSTSEVVVPSSSSMETSGSVSSSSMTTAMDAVIVAVQSQPEPVPSTWSSSSSGMSKDDWSHQSSVAPIEGQREEEGFVTFGSFTNSTTTAMEQTTMTNTPLRRVSATEDEFSPAPSSSSSYDLDEQVMIEESCRNTSATCTTATTADGKETFSVDDAKNNNDDEPLNILQSSSSCSPSVMISSYYNNGDAIDLFGARFHFVDTHL